MEPGTSLRVSQPRSAEKRLRKRKELDALVSNMYTKVRSSGGNGSSLGASTPARGSAARQLLGAKYSSESDSEKFAALEDDDEDDVENPGFCASKITSTGSSGGSNRKFKSPYTLIRNGGGSSSRKSSHRTASSSSTALRVLCQCLCYCATAVISGMTVAAIFWLHVQLRIQAQDFNSQISKVIDEKAIMSDQHRLFQSQIEALASNQTNAKTGLNSLSEKVENLSKVVAAMNGSLMLVMKSLESAPLLKSLPSTVLAVQTEVAELASKLADLELQLTRSEKEVAGAIDGLKQSVSNDKISPQLGVSEAKLVSLETFQAFQDSIVNRTDRSEAKIESVDAKFKEFAIQITDQLQRQETRATKSWEVLSQLEDNVMNVSAKAISSEVICAGNQLKLEQVEAKLETGLKDFENRLIRDEQELTGLKKPVPGESDHPEMSGSTKEVV